MIVKFQCDDAQQHQLAAVVESVREETLALAPFIDHEKRTSITREMIENGFCLVSPIMLYESADLPEAVRADMDAKVRARGFTVEEEIDEYFDAEKARALSESVMKKRRAEAERILADEKKFDRFMKDLEVKLQKIPKVGGALSCIPTFICLLKDRQRGLYDAVPLGSVIGIVIGLMYFLSPLDLIPDAIAGLGFLDDAAVLAFVLSMTHDDVSDYRKWRDRKDK